MSWFRTLGICYSARFMYPVTLDIFTSDIKTQNAHLCGLAKPNRSSTTSFGCLKYWQTNWLLIYKFSGLHLQTPS